MQLDDGLVRGPVVVMYSGGRDSTCLLHLAASQASEVTALHVDHGIRPESAAVAEHCARVASSLGVPLVTERVAPPPATGNLHAWAREARYAAAFRLEGCVAVGHTASDQVETVLY